MAGNIPLKDAAAGQYRSGLPGSLRLKVGREFFTLLASGQYRQGVPEMGDRIMVVVVSIIVILAILNLSINMAQLAGWI